VFEAEGATVVFAGRHERGAGALLPDRPPVAGPRWRPHESHNQFPRPKDLAAYEAQFEARPPATDHRELDLMDQPRGRQTA
jgi:hypothetical protein